MKRKSPAPKPPAPDAPVAPEVLRRAQRLSVREAEAAAFSERTARAPRCVVCSGEATQTPGEPLCWVCRRLKISAWREAEQQAPAQE